MSVMKAFNLMKWIEEHKEELRPPVSNKQMFKDEAEDVIVFVSGGPNTRNDFHVNPTEELFYQLKGDIAVRVRPLDGSDPYDVVIKEGELFLLPRWVPHRPQRPKDTLGLIVEFPRKDGELDHLQWYCDSCGELVHDAQWQLENIDKDLKIIMENFWSDDELRTCKNCNTKIEHAGEFDFSKTIPAPAHS